MTPTNQPQTDPHSRLEAEVVLKLGTDNQRERYAAGMLPEDELSQLARDELFKMLQGMPRWAFSKMRESLARTFKHDRLCQMKTTGDYEASELAELTHDEWARLKIIRETCEVIEKHPWLTNGRGKVSVRGTSHWFSCKHCSAEVVKSSVKVEIEWAGRTLTREYIL